MSAYGTYLELSDALEREIRELAPGTRVMSENELAAAHGVNRLTARAALQELERRYLVSRERGRGTFVARRFEYRIGPSLTASFSDAMRLIGATASTHIEFMRVRPASAWVREELGLAADARMVHFGRQRYVNGLLVGWAETYAAAELVPELRARLHDDDSLHRVLDRVYGLSPARAHTLTELEVAPAAVAARLQLPGRPLMLQMRGRTDSRTRRRPIEVTSSWLRADRFRLVFEMGDR